MWKWVFVIFALSIGSVGYCTDYDDVLSNAKTRAVAGDFTAAISLCTSVINAHPGAPIEPRARMLLGNILGKKRAPESDCIEQFAQIAASFPSSPEAPQALLRIGYLRERLKQPPAEWERIARDYPATTQAAEALHCLGHLALRVDDPATAIEHFRRSAAVSAGTPARIEDSTVEAGYAYISLYWKTHKMDSLTKAISTLGPLTRASASPKMAVKARLGRGEAFILGGLPIQAVREYQAALDLCRDDPYSKGIALFEIGCCKYGAGSWAAAVASFDEFLSAIPGATPTEKDQHWKQIRPDFARVVAIDPDKAFGLTGVELVPEVAYWKAASLLKLGRISEAEDLADSIATTFPGLRIAYKVRELKAACTAKETSR